MLYIRILFVFVFFLFVGCGVTPLTGSNNKNIAPYTPEVEVSVYTEETTIKERSKKKQSISLLEQKMLDNPHLDFDENSPKCLLSKMIDNKLCGFEYQGNFDNYHPQDFIHIFKGEKKVKVTYKDSKKISITDMDTGEIDLFDIFPNVFPKDKQFFSLLSQGYDKVHQKYLNNSFVPIHSPEYKDFKKGTFEEEFTIKHVVIHDFENGWGISYFADGVCPDYGTYSCDESFPYNLFSKKKYVVEAEHFEFSFEYPLIARISDTTSQYRSIGVHHTPVGIYDGRGEVSVHTNRPGDFKVNLFIKEKLGNDNVNQCKDDDEILSKRPVDLGVISGYTGYPQQGPYLSDKIRVLCADHSYVSLNVSGVEDHDFKHFSIIESLIDSLVFTR